MTAVSWLAVLVGFTGTWVAGRHRTGWLIAATSAALWLIFDVERSIPAGTFAAAVAIVLAIRNYRIGRPRRES